MDTSGFYKLDNETLLYGKNEVWNKDYHLTRDNPPSEPVDGWHWFDSEAEARDFFGLPEIQEEDNDYHNQYISGMGHENAKK